MSARLGHRIIRRETMNTFVGTSGFQYTEWKGNFYPEDLPTAKMLPYFAERLATTEINYTFHRIPAPTLEMSNISKAFVVPLPSTT